jgi:hypothetical protein
MMKTLIAAASMITLPIALNAQVAPTTTASGTGGTSVKNAITAPLVMTPEQRHAFEPSLTGVESSKRMGTTQPTVALSWAPVAIATGYRVLRYSMLTSPPAVLTPAEKGTQYVAQVLPANTFYFRVVALSGTTPLDTTVAYSITIPNYANGAGGGGSVDRYNVMGTIQGTCTENAPSSLALTWPKRADVGEYAVRITRDDPSQNVVASTTVTSGSFTQNGIPAGPYNVRVTGSYVMRDYPVPGQVTKVDAELGRWHATFPVTTQSACN